MKDEGLKGRSAARQHQKFWEKPFQEAYQEMQRKRYMFNEQQGPVDIYAKKQTRLLLLWAVTPKAKLDWRTLGDRWEDAHPEISLAMAAGRLGSDARAGSVWRKAEQRSSTPSDAAAMSGARLSTAAAPAAGRATAPSSRRWSTARSHVHDGR